MRDFVYQAEKNGELLKNFGKCQFCGSDVKEGVFECLRIFSNGFPVLDFNEPDYQIYRFLSVDAHALQHTEIHGRWSNHFHLTRLNLIIEKNVYWNYSLSPLLSNFLNEYKISKPDEILLPPENLKRGVITVLDIDRTAEKDICRKLILNWAKEVYESWFNHHSVVSAIAVSFLEKNNTKLIEYL